MSELINNREYRQKKLKELIFQLHDGKRVEDVQAEFAEIIKGISATEISEMEGALVKEGMSIPEIQRLCDVHAAVFKGSIEEIHRDKGLEETPGHPIHTFRLENRGVEALIEEKIQPALEGYRAETGKEAVYKLLEGLNLLWDIDKHYLRKENLLFPFMEKYGITAPPKVMWGVDDEIRAELKAIKVMLQKDANNKDEILAHIDAALKKIKDMIFKEENILFPMVIETLSEDEWETIEKDSDELGYCITEPEGKWAPYRGDVVKKKEDVNQKVSEKGYIKFDTGLLSTDEIGAVLNTLPLDITFVDKDGLVKYFSQGKERIFPRTKSIIGREVSNCHPPASVHIVEQIVEDLKSGKKDHEDFWIKMKGQFIYIRYFAVRNDQGEFLGTLEVTQNIQPITELTGEKRLMS